MKKIYVKLICLWLLLLPVTYSVFAQQQLLTGTITDEANNPIPDVLISIKEQPGITTNSDKSGKFTIAGQIGQHIEATSGQRHKTYRIETNPVTLSLTGKDAVISLGFGIERDKEEITSAIGIVGSDELSKSMAINPANVLFGKIPGLAVLQNGGMSWENDPTIFIRGVGTFRDASILTLVDGFERPVSSLSLGEIESVEILKDAAALAMYGQRGANGVLLVTTKRADAMGSKAEVSFEHGITEAFRLPKFLDAYGYARSMNEARSNDGLSPLYSQQDLDAYKSGGSPFFYPNVNWLNESFRNFGETDNLKTTFQGKTKDISYFTLLNYQTDKGLLGPVNDNEGYSTQLSYGKFNFRSNLDIDITKSTKFRVNLGGNLRETRTPGTSIAAIMSALYTTPAAAFPVKTFDNIWGGTSYYDNNPVAQITASGYRYNHTRELLADGSLEQKLDFILPGLSAEVALAYDNSATYTEGKTRKYQYESLAIVESGAGLMDTVKTIYGNDTELSYSSSLSNQMRHATAWGKLKYIKEWGTNSINSALLFQQDKLVRNGKSNTYLHQLVAGNLHYSRDMKYFADLSVSYSGTNMLPRGSRFGLFPALSLAWKLSDEDWFAKNGLFDNLKIRSSWGMTGNDLMIPQDISESTFPGGPGYYFSVNNNAQGGLKEGSLRSTGLTYETSVKSNVGVDASMFGMLELSADVFYDHRKNILVETDGIFSNVLGIVPPLQNSGIVINKGIELGINFHNNKGAFTYYVNGQFSYVRNKIVEMGEVYRPFDYLKRTGRSIGQAFGLEAVGFFKDLADIAGSPKQLFSVVKPGDIKYKDQNNDGVIDVYDEKPLEFNTRNPEIYYSASFGLEYKGFGIDALLQGIANQTIYLNTPSVFWPLRGQTTISGFSDNRWTLATVETASLPRLSTLENLNNYRPNSIWYINGSYLKLRSFEIYYNLPNQFISKLKLSNTRLFIRGIDLISIDHVHIVDPESIGITYPTCATYSLGIKIGF